MSSSNSIIENIDDYGDDEMPARNSKTVKRHHGSKNAKTIERQSGSGPRTEKKLSKDSITKQTTEGNTNRNSL